MFTPPTDNLYKFIAIFGLVLFGFSIYVPLQRFIEYHREVAKHPSSLDLHDEQAQQFTTIAAGSTPTVQPLRTRRDLTATRRNQLDQMYAEAKVYRTVGVVLGLIGAVMVVVGFWLWYVRVQRHLDAAAERAAPSS